MLLKEVTCKRQALLSFLLSLACLLGTQGCTGLFFQPQKAFINNPVALKFHPRNVYFRAPDGPLLNGWLFKAKDKKDIGTVIVLHGNGGNISTQVGGTLWLVTKGFNLFIFDYRGYGRSGGRPGIDGAHRDAEAALETALKTPGISHNIIILGQSLGGAIAVFTVANSPYKNHIKALVIDSAFASYRGIARQKLGLFFLTWPFKYPLSFLFDDKYSPVKWIKKVSPVPVLIFQGRHDNVVPAENAGALYKEASPPKYLCMTDAPGHIMSFSEASVRDWLATRLRAIVTGKEQGKRGKEKNCESRKN